MTKISLRGMLMVAVSTAALTACTSDSSNTDALNAANATIASKTATIAERDATIAEKNAAIAVKQASIDAANASIATLTTDKVNLLATVIERNETIDGLEADIDALQAEIDAANADIASLEADVADLQALVDAGDADIVDLQNQIEDAQAEIDALTAANTGLEDDLDTANADIAAKQATIDAANATITAKQADLNAANATIVSHLATIAARDGTIVTKNADIAAKASTISGLEDDVAGLEADVADLLDQVDALLDDIAALEDDIVTLEDEKADLEAENADLQSQVTNYNKNAFNANRGKTDAEDGGYVRNAGVLAVQPERADIAAAQSAVTVKQAAKDNAQTNYNTAATAATEIGNTRTAAQALDTAPFDGQSLAIFKAASPSGAALYAEVMGLDITDANDLASLVDTINFLNVGIVNLTTEYNNANDAANNANDALNDAIAELGTAQDALSDANDALTAAIAGQKGTASVVQNARSALSDAQDLLAAKYDDVVTADAAVADAQAAYDEASNFVVDPGYDGQSIATYFADLQSDAEYYAEVMGLDLTDSDVQGLLVSAADYASAVSDLNDDLTDALTAANDAMNQRRDAADGVTNAEDALDTAIANYRADRAPQQSSPMTLYQADGSEVVASGAMVYKQSLNDSLVHGQGLVEAGRLTALFLVDENGDPTEVLVFEASMLGASSESNPFILPAGAATFESSSMVAAFAQLESDGGEDGVSTYSVSGDTDAGSLIINFDDNTGRLVVVGLPNGGSSNQDFSVNAELTFDVETGTFSADGISQAYTSNETGLGEVATGTITGALNAVADAFTVYIDTTDETGLHDLDVLLMTRIVGTGFVTTAVTP